MADNIKAMHKIIHIAKAHHSVIESRIKDVGMHRSLHIMLMMLEKCENPPSQTELAKILQISPAAVAVTLDKLEGEGYIEKTTPDGDRRSKCVVITEKGRATLKETGEIFIKTDKETFSGLSDEEIERLCGYLDIICKNLSDMKNEICQKGDGL